MRNYRNAFVFAVVGNIALVGILGGLWWRSTQLKKTEAALPSASNETTQNAPNGPEAPRWHRMKFPCPSATLT